MPVLVIRYFPLKQGEDPSDQNAQIDKNKIELNAQNLGDGTVSSLRNRLKLIENDLAYSLTQGSRYHGYKDSNAKPSLNYDIVDTIEHFEEPTFRKVSILDDDFSTGAWSVWGPWKSNYYLNIILDAPESMNRFAYYYPGSRKAKNFHLQISDTGKFEGEQRTVATNANLLSTTPKLLPPGSQGYQTRVTYAFDNTYKVKYFRISEQIFMSKIELFLDNTNINLESSTVNSPVSVSSIYSKEINNKALLEKENICDWVDSHGVKEVWAWVNWGSLTGHYESIMSSPQSLCASNSPCSFSGSDWIAETLPKCEHTYVLYQYNPTRGLGEALEDHTHQIESELQALENGQEGNQLFSNQFIGTPNGAREFYRCGWTHYPPNVMKYAGGHDYDWGNINLELSDCEDWKPSGSGEKMKVNCERWNNLLQLPSLQKYQNTNCWDDGGASFKVWWMQNLPGMGNGLSYQDKPLINWWKPIADWDDVVVRSLDLTCVPS